jgi:murein L,D-transpeptidase YafK
MRNLIFLGLLALTPMGCSKFHSYDGPQVTRLVVHKSARQLVLYHHDQPLRAYDVELGFAPEGHKQQRGDGKTPEGNYIIDRRNPNSAFHLSLGISYPNSNDMARASAAGVEPGGDIFIHGQKGWLNKGSDDWTAGCIAVTNKEIREIYAMVGDDTPIDLYP